MAKTALKPEPKRRRAQTPRDRFVAMTAKLMMRHGYAGMGLNDIVARSGAPKGSLYHYFPEGKEQLAVAAIGWASSVFRETLTAALIERGGAAGGIRRVTEQIAVWMEESQFKDGSPLTIVALETSAFIEAIRLACQEAYQDWIGLIEDQLRGEGKSDREAADLALHAVAAIEGAIVLARVQRSAEPLRRIGKLLQGSLR